MSEKAIATISKTKETLEKYGLKAQKKYGQNFLIDPNIVDKIARCSCDKEHLTIEIGPGIGSLTQMLSKYSRNVISYEIDPNLLPVLEDNLGECDNVTIVHEDFLNVDLDAVSYKRETINVCANLPYYVTTPILFKLFESDLSIGRISVMVQKEVADRFKAEVGSENYNALSVMVQYLYDVSVLMQVSRNVFLPKPNVDSTVITFVAKKERNRTFEQGFFPFVKRCFTQRRKTLYNNLKEHVDGTCITKALKRLNLKPSVRAQELSLDEFIQLYEVIYER